MILEKQTENLVLEEGESQKTYGTEIDMDSIQFLKQMLSKFYADPIGSLIRETASNALDSHREAGVKDPIIVSFKANKDGNYEFSVEDFGVGVNEETIDKILRKYGKSTKRKTNTQLGMYGLGWKSPIAYTSSFYFIGRKDGIETKAMMYESADDVDIDILYTAKTEERNGTKVIVPVKYGDRYSFIQKIQEQLAYFEDVYFNCENINNDFKIIRHDLFQYSTLCKDNSLHLCLDNVYYPIDFNKLGISRIDKRIGLKFTLSDGIYPTPNRESVKYSKEAIEIIKNKIKELSEYLVIKYNETIEEKDNIFAIVKYFENSSRDLENIIPESIDVSQFERFSKVSIKKPKLKNIKLLDLYRVYIIRQYLINKYSLEYEISNGRFSQIKRYNQLYFSQLENADKIYIFADKIHGNKKNWLKEQHSNNIYFVKEKEEFPLMKKGTGNYDNWYNMLELKKYPKNQWRDIIKEAQYIRSLMVAKFVDLDKIDVPEEWIKARKAERATIKTKKAKERANRELGEITGKLALSLSRYVSGKSCKFESTNINMNEAYKQKYFTVYGGECDIDQINNYFKVFPRDKVKFVTFSARELKRLEKLDIHNWIKMEDFKKGEHKVFRRAVTAYLIHKLYDKNTHVFSKDEQLRKVSTKLADKVNELKEYKDQWYVGGNDEVCEAMVKVAEATNLYDTTVYSLYLEINEALTNLSFLNIILKQIGGYYGIAEEDKNKLINAMRDLCKYHKYRIDWQYYKPEVDEEVLETKEVEI